MEKTTYAALGGAVGFTLSSGAAFAIELLPRFKLAPLARWKLQSDEWMTVLPVLTGAAIALLYPPWNLAHKKRVIWIGSSVVAMIISLLLYDGITDSPPTASNVWWYSNGARILYLLVYFLLGFALTQIGKVVVKASAKE